jgi:hypothetical protein
MIADPGMLRRVQTYVGQFPAHLGVAMPVPAIQQGTDHGQAMGR